jgi:hypothetical protein
VVRLGRAEQWWAWVKRGWPIWLSVVLAVSGLVAWKLAPNTQDTIRRIGLAYEVIGVLSVLVDVGRAMSRHEVSLLARWWDYFQAIPCNHRPKIIEARFDAVVNSAASLSVRVIRANPTMEQRIADLEATDAQRAEQLARLEMAMSEMRRSQTAAAQAEAATRERRVREVTRDVEVGSLKLTLFGLLWLLIGALMTTGTPELCGLVSRCV